MPLPKAPGLAWLCSTCTKFTKAREAGIAGLSCMAAVTNKVCGSPLVSLDFPQYEGQVTEFSRWCFVCGSRGTRGMRAKGTTRVFGVCEAHGPSWAALQHAPGAAPTPPADITHQGNWMGLDLVPRKKSLAEHMLEFDPQSFDGVPDAKDNAGEGE